jgi:hypothetical protein
LLRSYKRPLGVLLVSVSVPALLIGVGARAAEAHPFGDPQRAEVAIEGEVVRVTWNAAADDLTSLAIHLDLVPTVRAFVYENGALVPEESDDDDAALLAGSAALSEYLVEHIAVTSVGESCSGAALPVADLGRDGATVEFACPADVAVASVSIDMMTDLHPSYRTLAQSRGNQSATYTLDTPAHDFRAVAGGDGARSVGPDVGSTLGQVGAVGGAMVALGAGAWWWRRRARPSS